MPRNLKLESFPQDDRYWIVVWPGEIVPHPHMETEKAIRYILAPIKGNPHYWTSRMRDGINTLITYDYCVAEVSLGLIPFINIGSIWRNGRRELASLDAERQTFRLTANKETNKHLRPTNLYPTNYRHQEWPINGKGVSQAGRKSDLCVFSHNQASTNILVPHYVLISTFFGTSTRMVRAIYEGRFNNHEIYLFNRKRSSIKDGHATLFLSKNSLNMDMHTLALAAFSVVANSRFCRIYEETLSKINRRRYWEARLPDGRIYEDYWKKLDADPPMKIRPPFDGEFKIRANGVWIHGMKTGKHPKSFLVLNIEMAEFPLPYQSLNYQRANRNDRLGIHEPDNQAWAGAITQNPDDTDAINDEQLVTEVEDANTARQMQFDFGSKIEKPTQDAILPKRLYSEEQKSEHSYTIKKHKEGKSLSTSSGIHSEAAETTPYELVNPNQDAGYDEHTRGFTSRMARFQKAMDILEKLLRKREGRFVKVIKVSNAENYSGTFFAPRVFTRTKRIATWSFIDKTKKNRRRFLLIQISVNGRCCYLMEIETRPVNMQKTKEHFPIFCFIRNDFQPLSQPLLMKLIWVMTKRKSDNKKKKWWPRNDPLRIQKHTFNHPKCNVDPETKTELPPSAKKLAAYLLERLKSIGVLG